MPDITMCKGQGCPLRKLCYRCTAKPDKLWQSYFTEPTVFKGTHCCYYLRNAEAEATLNKRKIKDVGTVWPCKLCTNEVHYPVWGSGFLVCPSCGHETGMNDERGRAVREWNRTMKPVLK